MSQKSIEHARLAIAPKLDPARKAGLGQYLTPAPIAEFMASLFHRWPDRIRLLDPGAGIGSLSDAFASRFLERSPKGAHLAISAYEIDPVLINGLSTHLANVQRKMQVEGYLIDVEIHPRDFVREASFAATFAGTMFSHVILNPPYKKIGASSEYRKITRAIGIDAVNVYAAFLGLSIALVEHGGEIVAIVPRSFCNGLYFRRFRSWLLKQSSIQQIHLFESRRSAFRDDAVLQENVIIHLVRGGVQGNVTISTSSDATFSDYATRQVKFSDVVHDFDEQNFIHIPTVQLDVNSRLFTHSLADLGLDVSTGPVVDFRVREHWVYQPTCDCVPLLYAHHFFGQSN